MIVLRQAQNDEWPAIADLTVAANAEYTDKMGTEYWKKYEQSTRRLILSDPTQLRIVALQDDVILGSVVYCPPYEREYAGQKIINPHPEMRLLAILPNHRNNGIAARLIEACEQQAVLERRSAITLHTTRLMAVAKAMYERRGYSRYSEIDFQLAPEISVLGYIKMLDKGENHDSN